MQKKSSLQDIFNPPTKITLDGQELLLAYDYRAYAMLEHATQKSVYELKDEILDGKITLTNRLLLLYCGLLHHQSDFDIKRLQALANVAHFLEETAAPVLEAFFVPMLPPENH